MDAKEIRELIEMISRSDFSTFELERGDFKIRLVRGETAPAAAPAAGTVAYTHLTAPSHPVPAPSPVPLPAAPPAPAVDPSLVELTSPIVGTFYRSPSPGAPMFVETGSKVKKGQVLCIIEAMKLMNEIESEVDAEVVEIVVANGQPVEFGEVLFRLRPIA